MVNAQRAESTVTKPFGSTHTLLDMGTFSGQDHSQQDWINQLRGQQEHSVEKEVCKLNAQMLKEEKQHLSKGKKKGTDQDSDDSAEEIKIEDHGGPPSFYEEDLNNYMRKFNESIKKR